MKACRCRSTPALRIEQRYFTKILRTKEAAAMIRSLFVSMQELNKGARRPAGVPPTKIKKVGVIGAGFMGAGIAYVTAQAGIEVVLIDRDQEAADKGKAHSRQADRRAGHEGPRQGQAKRRAARPHHADRRLCRARRTATSSSRRCSRIREVKAETSPKAQKPLSSRDAIFASNTSTLPITGLAEGLRSARRISSASTSSRRSTR